MRHGAEVYCALQWLIEHAPPNSRRIRWFTRMSKGKSLLL